MFRRIQSARSMNLFVTIGVSALVAAASAVAAATVTSQSIKDNTIQSRDIKNGTVRAVDIAAATRNAFATDKVPHVEVSQLGAPQSIPNAAVTSVQFDHEVEDSNAMFSLTHADRLVAPTSGLYLVEATIGFESAVAPAGSLEMYMNVMVDGVMGEQRAFTEKPAGNDFYISGVSVVRLAAGNWITIKVRQDAGSAVNIQSSYTHATMTRLGT